MQSVNRGVAIRVQSIRTDDIHSVEHALCLTRIKRAFTADDSECNKAKNVNSI